MSLGTFNPTPYLDHDYGRKLETRAVLDGGRICCACEQGIFVRAGDFWAAKMVAWISYGRE